MRWRLRLKEFGPELKYTKGENNVVANALYCLEMSDNQDILSISEIYGYDESDLPDSAYPIRYHDISKSQKTDAKLNQKLFSHKDYTLDTFRGVNQNHCLICRNNKNMITCCTTEETVYWYHDMLCHPGETRTEHTLHQHFDWKGLRTTVHDVCKKCPTCQRAKTTNQKYGKLPYF